MTREQLLALGLSEEQVNQIMALHGQATQGLNATITQNNSELQRLRGIETDYNKLKNQPSSEPTPEPEPQNPELVEAQKQIAELRREMNRKDIAVYASSKQLSGEQAENILKAFADDVETAKAAIDSISQIITESNKTAIANYEKQNLHNTPNPDGGQGGNPEDKKPEDVKNAETITFGTVDKNAQSARDYYK